MKQSLKINILTKTKIASFDIFILSFIKKILKIVLTAVADLATDLL